MLSYHREPGTDIVEITIEGRVSRAEFDDVAAALEAVISQHGTVRVLEDIHSFEGIQASAFWDDLKFSLRHMNEVSRAAVVTDEHALEWFVRLVRPVVRGEIRTFHRGELDAARAWLREPA